MAISLVILIALVVSEIPRCHAHSSLVSCATALPVSGHGGTTTAGGGTVTLARAGTSLPCGSTVLSGERLTTVVQGTSGKIIFGDSTCLPLS